MYIRMQIDEFPPSYDFYMLIQGNRRWIGWCDENGDNNKWRAILSMDEWYKCRNKKGDRFDEELHTLEECALYMQMYCNEMKYKSSI